MTMHYDDDRGRGLLHINDDTELEGDRATSEQYTLNGQPIKRCTVIVRTDKGPLINAKIGGPQAERIVKAIVGILTDNQQLWECE